ncbi:3-hydroxyacyl-CoA dehydrogenase [Azospirillum sp. TSA2s]|uniref:3-hydroxyacyl-CoA dehydrogenase NAD-binding domain-containing protein n=1 Tax=Azospirillum sp. TSA2s TaxID=709810 RepID=UPI0010AB3577|nr:3-hydroxyacyl-CoA dehydrogenase NAD-binding domain-containing protein [Azospirillum sp. TSA2s]QCG94339.1 3-hydroxyacyl-CoA dehydrogenase [Azospirillum sp. TSA2s]
MTGRPDDRAGGTVRLERDGGVAVIVIDNPPVNAGSTAVRRGLLDAVTTLAADPELEAAVLIGAGRTFIAGSDLREFGQPLEDPQLPAVIAAIEACAKPVVAALHGAALGGGFELALGCDARVAAPGTRVGLPEVTLGMIPGAGGTQRLPRLVGLSTAIALICEGRRLAAADALALGLVDALASDDGVEAVRTAAVAHARSLAGRKCRAADKPVPAEPAEFIEAAAVAALRAGRGRPPVIEAIRAVRAAAERPRDEALAEERAVFQRLRLETEAFARRHLFFAERDAARLAELEGVAPRRLERIGVVGSGTMGTGIVIAALDAGLPVTLLENGAGALDTGLARLRDHYARRVDGGKLSAEAAGKRLAALEPTIDIAALATADLVIEAVFEDLEVKQDLFRRLDSVLAPGAVLASNTSYLDLDAIAAATSRPRDVVGLHFFSPANVMRLLEVVRGAKTSPDVLATALALAKRLGKLPVVAGNAFGFIGNRIYAAYRRQCEFLIEEGALPAGVDAALERFGFAMGPFAVADLSGLDIAWRMRRQQSATRDPAARYVEIPDRLCEAGRLGRKTGAGYYRYPPGAKRGETDPEVTALIEAASSAKGIVRRAIPDEEIVGRVLLTMVNEAACLLSEGVAARASDIDLVLVNGYGFPAWEGGPLFWATRQDPSWLRAELARLADLSGPGFRRCDPGMIPAV